MEEQWMPAGAPEEEAPEENRGLRYLFGWIDDLAKFFLLFILLLLFLVRPVMVNGTSMKNTLESGDVVLVRSAFYTPKQGDIVVVSREYNPDEPLIKRVIAVGGQTVRIDYAENKVYVDDVPLDEPYLEGMIMHAPEYFNGEVEYPYTVDEGCVFVLGDNRNNSTDSRAADVEQLANGQIMGQAFLRVYRDEKVRGDDGLFDWLA